MQKYPSVKNMGWRRLEGDYVPKNQIWMVLDEENDICSNNSRLDNSLKIPDSFVSNSCLESKEINFSPSTASNLLCSEKLIEDNSNLQSKSLYNLDSEDVPESNENKNERDGQKYTYSIKSRFSHLEKRKRNSGWESTDDNDEEESTDDGSARKFSRKRSQAKSVYNFDSEDESKSNEKNNNIDGQIYTYSRKPRFSHLLKNKRANDNDEKEHTDNESDNKNSRERLKVVNSKPKKDIIDVFDYTLKDIKNQRNSKKRELFNDSNAAGNNKQEIIRSSNRKRETVTYAEYEDECESDESEYLEENEIEDGNKIKINKKVESPDIIKISHLSTYEQMVERNKEANRRILEEMGILKAKKDLVESTRKKHVKKYAAEQTEVRRSHRIKLKTKLFDK